MEAMCQTSSMVNKRSGRPSGHSDARERLILTAQALIFSGNPSPPSSRSIAREAGVSHTLVNYHFGTKEELFVAAIALTTAPHHVVANSIRGGELDVKRLAAGIVAIWEHDVHGPTLAKFAREIGSGGPQAAVLSDYLERSVFDALVAAIGRQNARSLAIIIVGTIFTRYVLRLPMMTALSQTEVSSQIVKMAQSCFRPRS